MNEPAPSGPPAAEGIMTRSSPYTVAETVERLRAAIQSHNLTIFAEIDHAGAARQVGLAMQPAHVLIFGSPRAGTPLMNAAPLLALDLPLRLLVWQSADERVWMSSTSAAYLQARYDIPAALIGNIAGADAWIAQAIGGSQA